MNIKQRGMLLVASATATALCVAAAPSAIADQGSASAKTAVTATVASPASAKADGEAVFRGLFFGQGQVGQDLSKLELFAEAREHLDNDDLSEVRVSNAVIDLIDKKSPNFFADLSVKTRSGDPRQVEKAVTDAQNMLMAVAEKDDKATPVENGQLCAMNVAVAAVVVHVAAVVTAAGAVVTVTLAAGANFVKGKNWFWSPQPTTGDGTPLSKDEAVAQVTKALKAA
ncbi:sporulation delaying protein family toxin [Streptomyces sp. NPDC096033]|uniref:sporulation delaying protein family toxin n=1 Tax=Streptomyces sp. NPDC096033 TaxID=3366071 RepID=UPI0037FD70DD